MLKETFGVTVITTINFFNEERKFVKNLIMMMIMMTLYFNRLHNYSQNCSLPYGHVYETGVCLCFEVVLKPLMSLCFFD